MAVTQTSIYNRTLRLLGAARITSTADDNEQTRVLNDIYEDIRDEVLRAHPWNFAIKRAELAVLAATPEFEYDYQFQLPADCLRVIRTNESNTESADFKIEGDALLSNESAVKIKYIYQVKDTSLFDSLFVSALVARLASESAYAIVQSQSLSDSLYKTYIEKIKLAKSCDGQEGSLEKIEESSWLDSRE